MQPHTHLADIRLYYDIQMNWLHLVRGTSGSRLDTSLKRARRNSSLATSQGRLVGCMRASTVKFWTATPSEARPATIHRLSSGNTGGGRERSLRGQRSERGNTSLGACRCGLRLLGARCLGCASAVGRSRRCDGHDLSEGDVNLGFALDGSRGDGRDLGNRCSIGSLGLLCARRGDCRDTGDRGSIGGLGGSGGLLGARRGGCRSFRDRDLRSIWSLGRS
jgi:hypothetical protein